VGFGSLSDVIEADIADAADEEFPFFSVESREALLHEPTFGTLLIAPFPQVGGDVEGLGFLTGGTVE
jgi:hypothetical protein